MKFSTKIQSLNYSNTYRGPHFELPENVLHYFLEVLNQKRVVCVLNEVLTINRAIMQANEKYFILMNKDNLKQLNLDFGDEVTVEIAPDESDYGMPISEEMQEVLFSDPEGADLFHKLTLGKQRSLIHLINNYKSSQLKIDRSFVILQHIKNNAGKVNLLALPQEFKILINYKLLIFN